jgi:parallel beta-helix repeat protein
MSKALALALVLVFLILIISCTVWIIPAKAQYQGYITINSDGSVTPSSASIVHNEDTYTLASDIKGTIVISKSNITFNGNGHTINQQATNPNSANAFGIHLSNVYNVTVANTTITNTGNGVYAIENPTAGIFVENGGSNTIVRNDIVNNYAAISFLESNNNLVIENNIVNNNYPHGFSGQAVMLWGASNNKIFQNNFIDNKFPAGTGSFNSQSTGNIWDNGTEGNFWDDYNGTDADGNGIGDTPYEIYTRNRSGALFPKNTDHYPLMTPFNSTLYSLKTTPPAISILSPIAQTYNESDVSLTFLIDKPVNNTGYSLDGIGNFTLSGNTTLADLAVGRHNVTIFAQDTFGNIGSSQTISFTVAKPEPESFPVVSVATVAVALVVAGLLVYHKKHKAKA